MYPEFFMHTDAEILAQENVNIENMINKSKADYAYTLVDVDTPLHDAVLAKPADLCNHIRKHYLHLPFISKTII